MSDIHIGDCFEQILDNHKREINFKPNFYRIIGMIYVRQCYRVVFKNLNKNTEFELDYLEVLELIKSGIIERTSKTKITLLFG